VEDDDAMTIRLQGLPVAARSPRAKLGDVFLEKRLVEQDAAVQMLDPDVREGERRP